MSVKNGKPGLYMHKLSEDGSEIVESNFICSTDASKAFEEASALRTRRILDYIENTPMIQNIQEHVKYDDSVIRGVFNGESYYPSWQFNSEGNFKVFNILFNFMSDEVTPEADCWDIFFLFDETPPGSLLGMSMREFIERSDESDADVGLFVKELLRLVEVNNERI